MKKPRHNDKVDMTLYSDLLADIKTRIRQAQNRAVMSANAEMIGLYWDIGRMVAAKQDAEGWEAAVIPRLAVDLRNDLPEIKGFSERNMRRMVQFYKEYLGLFLNWPRPVANLDDAAAPPEVRPQPVAKFDPNDTAQPAQDSGENQIVQQAVAQLPWAHNVILIQKLKDLPTRLWYARQAIAQGWSRDTLANMIKSNTHKRQGAAVTNFDTQRTDFIVLVDDGHEDPLYLIVEIKGYRREDAKEKKSTMETYWVPGVNNLGQYGRWAFAEFTEVYQIEADFKAKVEAEFNKMIEQITPKKV